MQATLKPAAVEVTASPVTLLVSPSDFLRGVYLDAFQTRTHGWYYSKAYIFDALLKFELPQIGSHELGFRRIDLAPTPLYDHLTQIEHLVRDPARRKFQRLLIEGRSLTGWGQHSVMLAIDFAKESCFYQDSGGNLNEPFRKTFEAVFPGYDVQFSELQQQYKKSWSCALHTLVNMVAWARGEAPHPSPPEDLLVYRKAHVEEVLKVVSTHCNNEIAKNKLHADRYTPVMKAINDRDGETELPLDFAFVTTLIRLEQGKPFRRHSAETEHPHYDWYGPRQTNHPASLPPNAAIICQDDGPYVPAASAAADKALLGYTA